MSVSEEVQDDGLLSPSSASGPQPQWPRPRSPIPPHRLAKLANALGIATPVPMGHSSSDPSSMNSSRSDFTRSPTPSTSAASRFTTHSSQSTASNFQSKYLLHVIPPHHLPHDTANQDVLLTPPPSSASGYHKHFRRGTLVPFLPSFQAQLGAIAKEYALPNTTGMILYLVAGTASPAPSPTPDGPEPEEPGPRLTEDVWKHLWTRVVKTELDGAGFSPRSGTPIGLGLNPPSSASTATLTSLRPLVTATNKPSAPSLSLSTPSSTTRTNAASESDPEASTPDTSLPSGSSRADSMDLPGLSSPSLIPILAKVEFDIDKRKATWYAPWLRSRKQNLKKRSPAEDGDGRIGLRLVDRRAVPRFLVSKEGDVNDGDYDPEYAPRSESPDEDEDYTVRVNGEDDEGGRRRRGPPPPLTMPSRSNPEALIASGEPSPLPSGNSADSRGRVKLPYRESDEEDDGSEESRERRRRRKMNGGDRRTGVYFDELDLGLEFDDSVEYDENDPYDKRRSQFLMKARLDELEKNLASLSPRRLQHEDEPSFDPSSPSSLTRSRALSPQTASHGRYLSASSVGSISQSNSDSPPKWPAVPYSALSSRDNDDSLELDPSVDADDFPAPPKFAINGISTAVPSSPYKASFGGGGGPAPESAESAARRRAHDEGHDPRYPDIMPASLRRSDGSLNSPIIPLSPDPFGRFPSEPTPPMPGRTSESSVRSSTSDGATLVHVRTDSIGSLDGPRKLSSRFSLDSEDQFSPVAKVTPTLAAPNQQGASLNPVKSIRTLWRKSRKTSVSHESAPRVANPAPPMPTAMPRVSEEVVTNAMLPPNHPSLRAPTGSSNAPFMTTAEAARRAKESSISAVTFDQESPYPIRRAGSPRSAAPSPTPPPPQATTSRPPSTEPPARKSILKGWGAGNGRPSLEENNASNGVASTNANGKERKRRPSMIDLVRGSRASTATEALPPSPMLPEQYRSSESSSRASPPPITTPTAAVDEPFEIVEASPGQGGHGKTPSLSYPYHELDHQT
ncbi:unnamed protein product [Peniophora sp. CBMAI 1063]|nr:unnamed protein product [Peniophora sp. CBMAI 1063]